MRKYISLVWVCSLLALLICWPCNGQNKARQQSPRLRKNYFIKEYPQEFFAVQCGLQDKKGNLWFGTGPDGIFYFNGQSFINFTKNDGLCHNDILCCTEDIMGNIWFGTRNGLIRYKPSSGKPQKEDFTNIIIHANTISNSTHKLIPYDYKAADNFVWSILQDKTGKIWMSTNKGIYIYDPADNMGNDMPHFTSFLDNDHILNKSQLHLRDVRAMTEDKDGNIWFASAYKEGEGICRYDGRSVTNLKPDGVSSFFAIMQARNGRLFLLSIFHGVYMYDGKTFVNFTKGIGITNDTISALKEDHAGNLWIGMNSFNMLNKGNGGVWQYDGRSLKLFTAKNGLSHNCVSCIIEDRDRNLWFGTRNTGLCCYNGKHFTDFTGK